MASTVELSATNIAHRRLAGQRISATTWTRPEQVVAWLGAVQAQDYLGALWAIGLRLRRASERDVERALAERRIVRTWPMRGTLHFVAAHDARWMTELLAPRAAAAAAGRLRALGIDEPVLRRARRVLVRHLEGGRRLTRSAAYGLLQRAKIETDGARGLHVLWRLAHEGLICFGPRESKQHTFVLFDEWLPGAKRLPRGEALAELAHRYFAGHGPATVHDFAWWSGLTLADARLAVVLAGKRITEESADGTRQGSGPSFTSAPASRARAFLLPAFDEFLVGYTRRTAPSAVALAGQVNAGGGIVHPVIVIDGQVVGTWKRRIQGPEVVVAVTPLSALSQARTEAVARAFRGYARFLGLDLRQT